MITEVVYLLATRLGPEPEVRFLGDLAGGAFQVEPVVAPDGNDIARRTLDLAWRATGRATDAVTGP